MKNPWIQIVIAAIFELCWVVGLKTSETWLEQLVTIFFIFLSFYFLIKATQKLPVGTAYAVFVGLGTTGTVILDSLLLQEPLTFIKICFIGVLLIGVVGLKMLAPKLEEEK